MSKTTNRVQMQQLLTLMEANPNIACGFHKGSKEALTRFWRNAETELNSMGPPTKCVAEWKKVWADQKKYVRQKAGQNLKNKKGTGGGPNKEQPLSTTEEAIFQLIGMKSSVEGVKVMPAGLDESHIMEELLVSPQNIDNEDEIMDVETQKDTMDNISPAVDCNRKKTPYSQKDQLKNSYDALQAEIVVQKELLEAIKVVSANQKEQDQTNKRIYRSLDKLGDLQKKHFQEMEILKRKEIEETKRHNSFMEKLRVTEVEYKLEKTRLEIQEYRSEAV